MVRPVLRGEVYWGDLDPVVGHEQAGTRSLLIVQNDAGNAVSPTVIVAAITAMRPRREYPFLVTVPADALPRPSVVNCSQLRTLDKSRLSGEAIARLDAETMSAVDDALRVSLGLY
ncbi:MAG: PemK family transcriptional regulator [Coriobacteriaceae bacterium]|nr:PemK family transcriptional regulator [Coriobacteriaceae bacterium]